MQRRNSAGSLTASCSERWVCPSDRSLALRAKLRMGWCTGQASSPARPEGLSAAETAAILEVIQRAEQLDMAEHQRIGRLVGRVTAIREKAQGDGKASCILCGERLPLLPPASICHHCRQGVCNKCAHEQLSGTEKVLLCKICSETREMWKRTGAWFYRGLPQKLLPSGGEGNGRLANAGSQSLGGSSISIALLGRHSKAPPRRAHSLLSTDLTSLLRIGDKESDSESGSRQLQHFPGSPSLSSSLSPAASTSSVASLAASHCSPRLPRNSPHHHQQNHEVNQLSQQTHLQQKKTAGFSDIFGGNVVPEEKLENGENGTADSALFEKLVSDLNAKKNTAGCAHGCNGAVAFDYDSDSSDAPEEDHARHGRENGCVTSALRNDVTAAAPSDWNEAQDLQFCASETPRNILSAKSSKESKDSFDSPVFTTSVEDETSSVSLDWCPETRETLQRHGSITSSVCSSSSNSTLPLGHNKGNSNNVGVPATAGDRSKPSKDNLGSLEFTLFYDSHHQSLHCTIHHAQNLKSRSSTGSADPYVKLHLLPGASKSNKLRTRTVPKNLNPEFQETLTYHGISTDDISNKTLRLLVMDEGRLHRYFLGEARVALKRVKAHESRRLSVQLSDKINGSDDQTSTGQELGRLLLSLRYTSARGALIVGIVRCAHLRARDKNGYSDPYVKVQLKPDPHKRKLKTAVKWKNLNPEFNSEFTFEVRRNELPKRQLDVRVYDKDVGRSDDFIGGLVLGHDSRGPELRHWYDVLQYPDRRHDRWHNLRPMHSC
ncbi:rabphilin-1 [Hyalella azteca]|uniref:Rabphilin-1 n=1 Tax=Hyalella azteca TaxID=294128 RepID=A0A979FP27_HYAAZ|nr:rabphilin-1 [Hyalella azteca]XP_047738834.1 rabphilin-1 [Hyalella azteca]XP_047738835.1 rabphilin-1 [Hyalella azteca]